MDARAQKRRDLIGLLLQLHLGYVPVVKLPRAVAERLDLDVGKCRQTALIPNTPMGTPSKTKTWSAGPLVVTHR